MGTFTLETGLGLLGCGMLLILVGGLIIWKIITYKKKEDTYGR